jgi:signal peptidase I
MSMKSPGRFAISLSALLFFGGCKHVGPLHAYTITSKSMEPTIYEGDKILTNESYYSNHAITDGDLVVFHHGDYVIIKRVSAIAGESIEGRDGVLVRNGHALVEPYAQHLSDPSPAQTFTPTVVPPGEIFVTGDNRDSSLDSRLAEFGVVHTSDVIGIATYVTTSKRGTGDHPLN